MLSSIVKFDFVFFFEMHKFSKHLLNNDKRRHFSRRLYVSCKSFRVVERRALHLDQGFFLKIVAVPRIFSFFLQLVETLRSEGVCFRSAVLKLPPKYLRLLIGWPLF